jgi:peptide/nickel transport system substrate-binding protein
VAAGLVLAACGGDDDGETTGTTAPPAATTAPSEGTDGGAVDAGASLVVGAVLEPTNLDIIATAGAALDQILLDNVYETLLTFEDGQAGPGLAAVPEVSEDGLTYSFALLEGVTFHDGGELTASDVVWSLEQSRAETSVASLDLASVASVTAVDDSTVELTLSAPDNNLLFNLSRRAGVVLDEGAADLTNTANGTGPFRFVEWVQGSSITLERYDGYHGDPAGVAEVTFQYFTDAQAAVNALTAGQADLLTGVSSDLIGPLQENPDYVVTEGTTNGEVTLGMNNSRAPFDNQLVRQAVRQAIDKEGVLALYNGFGTILGGPVPPTDPWYEDLTGTASYDPDAARALLEEAGIAEGTPLSFIYPNIYPITLAEYIATSLGDIGFEVEITTVEFSVWLEQVFTNVDYDLTMVIHVEPRDIGNYANPDYYWRYDSAEVQDLVAQAQTTPDLDESVELLRQAAAQIAADSPVDWLLLFPDLVVARQGVTGYPQNDTASRFAVAGITVSE